MAAAQPATSQSAIPPLAPEAAGEVAFTLATLQKKLGKLPNMLSTLAHAPAALNGYLAFSAALRAGRFTPAQREQIALAVAASNACDYCTSAHMALARQAGLSKQEAMQSMRAQAADVRTQELLGLAKEIVETQGRIPAERVAVLRERGISDADIMELVALVSLNIFTNYTNHIAGTAIDFPLVSTAGV